MPALAGPGLALPTPAPLRGIVFMVATVAARRGLFPPAPATTVASGHEDLIFDELLCLFAMTNLSSS